MSRPNKKRFICALPVYQSYEKQKKPVILTLDEYEAIRLIDFEDFTQDECAKMMDVARTTVQSIYASARKKMSESLVLGKELTIQGGDVQLCPHYQEGFKCRRKCLRHTPKKAIYLLNETEDIHMRIAVTYKDGQVFQHFGRSEFFKIYDVKDGEVVTTAIIPTNGQGHGALGNFLKQAKVDALICGGIGQGARNVLKNAEIALYPGVIGDSDEACKALIAGTLNYQPDIECHDHHDGHSCADHDCGGHCH